MTYTLDLTLFCPWARRSVILGKLLIETESGKSISELVAEVSYTRLKGVEHSVINQNNYEIVFVKIELT